jgi:hypothetical protein
MLIVKQLVSQLPWGHIIILMQKVKAPVQAKPLVGKGLMPKKPISQIYLAQTSLQQ